jgi:hypothetical protein
VPRTGDIDDIQIVLLNQPVQMNIDEIEPGRSAPMPQQPGFDVFQFQRLSEQRIIEQINLAYREVVGSSPVSVQQF